MRKVPELFQKSLFLRGMAVLGCHLPGGFENPLKQYQLTYIRGIFSNVLPNSRDQTSERIFSSTRKGLIATPALQFSQYETGIIRDSGNSISEELQTW